MNRGCVIVEIFWSLFFMFWGGEKTISESLCVRKVLRGSDRSLLIFFYINLQFYGDILVSILKVYIKFWKIMINSLIRGAVRGRSEELTVERLRLRSCMFSMSKNHFRNFIFLLINFTSYVFNFHLNTFNWP